MDLHILSESIFVETNVAPNPSERHASGQRGLAHTSGASADRTRPNARIRHDATNKMTGMRSGFLILCLLLSALSGYADEEMLFKHYSLEEGLSHTTIYDIVQDRNGQMWFATGYGLNRYNGTRFIVYKNDRKDPNSIFENHIRSLFVDSQSRLWIGTQLGICRFNDENETFVNFPYAESGHALNVLSIIETAPGRLILGTSRGLYSFFEGRYEQLQAFPKIRITAICPYNGALLLGSDEGLYAYDLDSNRCKAIDPRLLDKVVMAILPDKHSPTKIWVGTEGQGLILFDMKTQSYVEFRHSTDKKSISSDYIRGLCYDSSNRLWIGTFLGLNVTGDEGASFSSFFHDKNDPQTISQSSIRTICLDNQGGMWFGSYFGGVNYYHPKLNRFVNLSNSEDNLLSDNIISVMHVDSKDNIWIGTNEQGLNYYDTASGSFKYYKHDPDDPHSISGNIVKAIIDDHDDNLYIGTYDGGLCYYDAARDWFSPVSFASSNVYSNAVYALVRGAQRKIWIGTLDGLFLFDPRDGACRLINQDRNGNRLPNQQIMALYRDTRGKIWIGTDSGLNRYDEATGLFEVAPSPVTDYRSYCCFVEDTKGNVWIGTRSGLIKYEPQTDAFIDLSTTIGFPDIIIYGIIEDDFGSLWISTSNGLINFRPGINDWFTYTEADGIVCNHFSFYSYCKTADGRMFFGSINGITSFSPESIHKNQYTPQPVIDELTLFNKPVRPHDATGLLKTSILYTHRVKFAPRQSTFGFRFSVPNYLSTQNNLFAYKLEGYNKEWIQTSQAGAEYSNLKPGRYRFRLKAANNSRIWGEEMEPVTVIVSPFWWQTWWAYLLFALIVILLIRKWIAYSTNKERLTHELELEKRDKQRIEQLNESKINFFINISHEFRTPLTLIISPLYEILKRGVNDEWLQSQLRYIERNAMRMMDLVNMVLDYHRSELGMMSLNVGRGDLAKDIQDIFDMFVYITRSKGIHYELKYTAHPADPYYDRRILERILSNLLSNAVKHTQKGGHITLRAAEREGMLVFEVQDTGRGIPASKLPYIFDRFYQVKGAVNGTGIGLSLVKNLVELYHGRITVQSTEGVGSLFRVEIPYQAGQFDPHEINPEQPDPTLPVREERPVPNQTDRSEDLSRSKSHRHILVVDDEEEIRNYLTENLSQYYKVSAVSDGEKALAELNKCKHIDLIISDVVMPGIDGIQLCKDVKQNVSFSHIPVLLLTAKSEIDWQLEGIQAGADDYLCKPFVFSLLRAKVDNIFRTRELLYRRYRDSEEDPTRLATNKVDQEFMERAVAIIRRNMDNSEFSTEELGRELGLSRTNLFVKLKAITGESAVLFIRRVKFDYACKLLKEGRYNVAEISAMVGFSPAYFTTRFKKTVGCLPSEYKKRGNKND